MLNVQLVILIVVVAAASFTDIRTNRIPNGICAAGIMGGFFWHVSAIDSIYSATFYWLIGLLSAGALLLPFYIMGGMAAGDVKLMAAVGGILGWPVSVIAVLVTLICGSVLAIGYFLTRGGGFREFTDRYGPAMKSFLSSGVFLLPPAKPGAISQSRFPYAVAIGCGSVLVWLQFNTSWSL